MRREFGFQIADLVVELGDDADCGAGTGPEGGGCGEVLGAQYFLNLQCRVSRLRWRPAALSADLIFARLSRLASAGVGARPRMASVSRSARSSNASNSAG
jgi:hypothetical protein